MIIPYNEMRTLTDLTVQQTIAESLGPKTMFFQDVEYEIDIKHNIFMSLSVFHKDGGEISIGNHGIHVNCRHIHSYYMEMKTEEEFFQTSLMNDYQDLEYEDYVRIVQYQMTMITALPLRRGSCEFR